MILLFTNAWQAGTNYFRNLLSCYRQHPDPEVKLELFSPYPEDLAQYRSDAIGVHKWPGMPARNIVTVPRRAIKRFLGIDPVLVGLLKYRRIDLMSHVWPSDLDALRIRADIPVLPWMPDFQHRRMPHFFSERECSERDAYVAQSRKWGHLLLSSQSAESDFRRFYPELAQVRTYILRFSCASAVNIVPLSREELGAHYPVRSPYFFLPNQFWQHKNHVVVVEALRQTPAEIRVLCTGLMDDHRSPGFIPSLMERVRQAGLEDRFVCLGTVPYSVLISLMHHSLAVVQPSRFEGWSTTVEEAKAMCKQIILSDIDAHVEQAPQRGVYFSPDSPEELAACLKRVYVEFDPSIEEGFAKQRPQYKARVDREWVRHYACIVKEICQARV
ncbi:MAG: glycosyltransferase [Terracidiphilus sp.]|jgi:glycosyltransferase involved in cell wall biosynthesis